MAHIFVGEPALDGEEAPPDGEVSDVLPLRQPYGLLLLEHQHSSGREGHHILPLVLALGVQGLGGDVIED